VFHTGWTTEGGLQPNERVGKQADQTANATMLMEVYSWTLRLLKPLRFRRTQDRKLRYISDARQGARTMTISPSRAGPAQGGQLFAELRIQRRLAAS
jgi:hypothetical protein